MFTKGNGHRENYSRTKSGVGTVDLFGAVVIGHEMCLRTKFQHGNYLYLEIICLTPPSYRTHEITKSLTFQSTEYGYHLAVWQWVQLHSPLGRTLHEDCPWSPEANTNRPNFSQSFLFIFHWKLWAIEKHSRLKWWLPQLTTVNLFWDEGPPQL